MGERESPGRMRYIPGLDGLRALSVLAVIAYHADAPWMPGGFLGVEVFFVISGYIITLLLTTEYVGRAGVAFGRFYQRRARRLLPSLGVVLLAFALTVVIFYREELAGLRGQVWSALAYVTNWHFIFSEQSYFAVIERPAILQHLWSLAIEEQFYLVWPVVLVALLRVLAGRRWAVAAVALAGAAVSAVWMASLFDPVGAPSRIYYGTDTRAAGLLIGAALGVVWPLGGRGLRIGPTTSLFLDLAGWMGLGVLLLHFFGTDEFDPLLYRGGLVIVDVATVAAIAAVAQPGTTFAWVMGQRPLVWIGLRSYCLYLWHWPIFVFTRPEIDLPLTAGPAVMLRLVLTVVAAELTYRYVEVPIRDGRAARLLARFDHRGRPRRAPARAGLAGVALVGVVVLGAVTTGGAANPVAPDDVQAFAGPAIATDDALVTPTTVVAPVALTPAAAPSSTVAGAPSSTGAAPTSTGAAAPSASTTTVAGIHGITVVTDSVLLGARAAMRDHFGAQGWDFELRGHAAIMINQAEQELEWSNLPVGNVAIVGLGYNSLWERDRRNYDRWAEKFDREADLLIEELMELGAQHVIWVTVREPDQWVVPPEGRSQYRQFAWFFPYVNQRIRLLPSRHDNVVVADWEAVSNQPGLTYDAIHLSNDGIDLMIQVLDAAVDVAVGV